MDKVLSIIIPTYNMERYLRKCLDSLIISNENMGFLEVLVINDGSKDSSSQIAHQYEIKYPQTFRVIDKENGNYGSCINRGLKEAKGNYIKILDADDYFDTANFSLFIELLKKKDVDCVITDFIQVNYLGEKICRHCFKLPKEKVFHLEEMPESVSSRLYMHAVCYKTSMLRDIKYTQTEGISYTDQEWVFLPMASSKDIIYYPHVVYKYFVGREGQTIDVKVWESKFWMEIQGCKVMMDYRNIDYGTRRPDSAYMNIRVRTRMQAIYTAYLSKFSTFDNEGLLLDIDKCLIEYDEHLYKYFDSFVTSKYIPIKIVRKWRNGKKWWIHVNRFVAKLSGFVKNIFPKLV